LANDGLLLKMIAEIQANHQALLATVERLYERVDALEATKPSEDETSERGTTGQFKTRTWRVGA